MEKDSIADEFLLAIKHDNNIVTEYQINRLESGAYSVDGQFNFDTIMDLVLYYQQEASRLVCYLQHSCILSAGDGEIDRNQILLMEKIGVGLSSNVHKGLLDGTVSVAIKEVKQRCMSIGECMQEAKIMKTLQHPNLIVLYGVCSKQEPFYYITEFMEHGSLLEYLKGEGRSLLSTQLMQLAAQVANGMAYLEEKNCYYSPRFGS